LSAARKTGILGASDDQIFGLKSTRKHHGRLANSIGTLIAQKAEFTDESAREIPPTYRANGRRMSLGLLPFKSSQQI
jgi:hypothetical protein